MRRANRKHQPFPFGALVVNRRRPKRVWQVVNPAEAPAEARDLIGTIPCVLLRSGDDWIATLPQQWRLK